MSSCVCVHACSFVFSVTVECTHAAGAWVSAPAYLLPPDTSPLLRRTRGRTFSSCACRMLHITCYTDIIYLLTNRGAINVAKCTNSNGQERQALNIACGQDEYLK